MCKVILTVEGESVDNIIDIVSRFAFYDILYDFKNNMDTVDIKLKSNEHVHVTIEEG